jgi:hypothetical protein
MAPRQNSERGADTSRLATDPRRPSQGYSSNNHRAKQQAAYSVSANHLGTHSVKAFKVWILFSAGKNRIGNPQLAVTHPRQLEAGDD